MHFGLITNTKRVGAEKAIRRFVTWANGRGHTLTLSDDLKPALSDHNSFLPPKELATTVEVLVSMGGDGTFLSAARLVGSCETKLLGINLGSLGFLTQQTPKHLEATLDAIVAGDYEVEDRMVLKAAIAGRDKLPCKSALNDIVLDNGPVSRVVEISLRINGEDVVHYIADGLIISTPTGSTAYNLAVGGPIVNPRMDAMIVAPISPFSLATRPMIISGGDQLQLRVKSSNQNAVLTLDGQVHIEIDDEEEVEIRAADFRSKFIVFPQNSYYKLLKSKLHWGVPPTPSME